MSSVRRVALAAATAALAFGALLLMVVTVNEPHPVDVRKVDQSRVQPGMLSATYTTTLLLVPSTTVVALAPPPQRPPEPPPVVPAPPAAQPTAEPTSAPPTASQPSPPTRPTRPKPGHPPWSEGCDRSYRTDGACVPWLFPRHVRDLCEWLRAHGLTRVEVHGRDRHHLDPDHDGIACGRGD